MYEFSVCKGMYVRMCVCMYVGMNVYVYRGYISMYTYPCL